MPVSTVEVDPDVQTEIDFDAMVIDTDCYYNPTPAYEREWYHGSTNWSSSETGVATINGSGLATNLDAGETTITAAWTDQLHFYFEGYPCGGSYFTSHDAEPCDSGYTQAIEVKATSVRTANKAKTKEPQQLAPCGPSCSSNPVYPRPPAILQVKPKITSISPTRGVVGNTTRVTIQGSRFRSGATVNAGAGISVSIVSFTSTQIVADFAIAANATGGNRNVTVTVRGATSLPKTFFVQIPTKARRDEITNIVIREPNPGDIENPFGVTTHTNVCGAYRNIKYTLVDQEDEPILEELEVEEILTNFTPSDPNISAPQANNTTTNR